MNEQAQEKPSSLITNQTESMIDFKKTKKAYNRFWSFIFPAEQFSHPISWRSWRKLLMRLTIQTSMPEKCSPWRLSYQKTEYRWDHVSAWKQKSTIWYLIFSTWRCFHQLTSWCLWHQNVGRWFSYLVQYEHYLRGDIFCHYSRQIEPAVTCSIIIFTRSSH